ncbi:BirA family transcriptional regulator, biotin operon repressor / biotin-[acetyl-CoA-carboxylase] ligase [Syntrophus gentianae]|uniref:Bifunctional ligase/repressor BirA n=2 Tax=Syntrophus gentianae TaxID=43775 RepID=A0A1H7Y0Z2_9BACT|nr:BirA family transcriptional regulator, biotin operon repressor / biotin-[acetyl-CoA-carboxylase] ligase [Syntrophus gentianae]
MRATMVFQRAMNTKERLLQYLKEEQGQFVSGEKVSTRLAISRSAIWKQISRLKEEGYEIESSPRKGYALRRIPDCLLAGEIREGLNSRLIGQGPIFHFQETDNTNNQAKTLAYEGAPEGALVIAEGQSQGRGRRGRTWFSPSGQGIYATVILRPSLSLSEAPKLTLMTAVATAEALESRTGLPIRIKWPNDILVNGRKLAGILTEIGTEMDLLDFAVIGLGLNVNIPKESFPPDLRTPATSLLIEKGEPYPRIPLLQAWLEALDQTYTLFCRGNFDHILSRWKILTDIVGSRIAVDLSGRRYTGVVQEVDENGVLILKEPDGTLQRIFSGDVTLLMA